MKKKVIKKVVIKKPTKKTAKLKTSAEMGKHYSKLVRMNMDAAEKVLGAARFGQLWADLGMFVIGLPKSSGIYLLQAGVRCLQESEAFQVGTGITKKEDIATPF
jgi:hypothetical protein